MSAKVVVFKLMDSVSLGASVNSDPLEASRLIYASFAVEYTGTPTGTITIELQNGESSWIPITGQTAALSGASGSVAFSFTILPWERIRLAYTRSGGTGTITVTACAKGW